MNMRTSMLMIFCSVVCALTAAPKVKVNEEVINTSQKVIYQEATSRYMEPSQCIMTNPLVADIKVSGKRITYTEQDAFTKFDVTPDIVDMMPNFKKIALCHAAQANNADMIIGATIDVSTSEDGHIVIVISGYPATYANFRNATKADFDIVERGQQMLSKEDAAEAILGNAEANVVLEENKKIIQK